MNKLNLTSGLFFATIGIVVVVFTTAFVIVPAAVFGEGEIRPALYDLGQWDGTTRIPEGWILRRPFINSFSGYPILCRLA